MKLLYFVSVLFLSSWATAQETPTSIEEVTIEKVSASDASYDLLGRWHVNIAYFINDGVKSEGSEPIVETTWIFHQNGDLTIQTNNKMEATYKLEGDKLDVTFYGTVLKYTIKEYSGTNMVLQSTILETEEKSMYSISEFSR